MQEVCQNYVRVLVQSGKGRWLVCGTNSFAPQCRVYSQGEGEGGYQVEREFSGTGVCPYDPRHNSTATLLPDSSFLYAATVTDRAASDPLIYRRSLASPIAPEPPHSAQQLRTQRYDLKTLRQPQFVSSFTHGDYVYFWFREMAVEADGAVYARVARVCRNDQGGPADHESWSSSWTSFLKARLNCSLPAAVSGLPFYFDQLQATTGLVESSGGAQLVYAVLSTPPSPVQMSAVCAFRLQDVAALFHTGAFLAQQTQHQRWLPLPDDQVPRPRPGQCTHDSRRLPPHTIHFIQRHSLMARPVPNYFAQPLLIDNSMGAQFTQVAVQSDVQTVGGRLFDVLFVGTADGRVLKLVTVDGAQSVVVESLEIFEGQPVRNLLVHWSESGEGRLVVVSEGSLRSVPLAHCSRQVSCSACVRLQDPHCAWDLGLDECRSSGGASAWPPGDYVQNVVSGRSSLCPEGAMDPEFYAVNDRHPVVGHSTGTHAIYSAASMSLAVIITLALALSLGFLLGFRISSWRKATHPDGSSTSSGSDYESHWLGLSRLSRHDATAKRHKELYSHPPSASIHRAESIRQPLESTRGTPLVVALPAAGAATLGRRPLPSLSTSLHLPAPQHHLPPPPALSASYHEKNNLLSLNNGTLPKDYRVKKVYL